MHGLWWWRTCSASQMPVIKPMILSSGMGCPLSLENSTSSHTEPFYKNISQMNQKEYKFVCKITFWTDFMLHGSQLSRKGQSPVLCFPCVTSFFFNVYFSNILNFKYKTIDIWPVKFSCYNFFILTFSLIIFKFHVSCDFFSKLLNSLCFPCL